MNKETFIEDANNRRKKYIEPVILELLAKMLKDDLLYFDAHYLENRTLEILERTVKKLKFENKDIEKARRAFLDVLIDGALKQMYGFEDDANMARENLKIKSEKEKAREVLKKVERLQNKTPMGKTEERDCRCEPVCQLIAKSILSKELMLKDESFVNGCIEVDNELLFTTIYRELFKEVFSQLVSSLDESYIRANEKNWGSARHEIKLSQIDNRLKE